MWLILTDVSIMFRSFVYIGIIIGNPSGIAFPFSTTSLKQITSWTHVEIHITIPRELRSSIQAKCTSSTYSKQEYGGTMLLSLTSQSSIGAEPHDVSAISFPGL